MGSPRGWRSSAESTGCLHFGARGRYPNWNLSAGGRGDAVDNEVDLAVVLGQQEGGCAPGDEAGQPGGVPDWPGRKFCHVCRGADRGRPVAGNLQPHRLFPCQLDLPPLCSCDSASGRDCTGPFHLQQGCFPLRDGDLRTQGGSAEYDQCRRICPPRGPGEVRVYAVPSPLGDHRRPGEEVHRQGPQCRNDRGRHRSSRDGADTDLCGNAHRRRRLRRACRPCRGRPRESRGIQTLPNPGQHGNRIRLGG